MMSRFGTENKQKKEAVTYIIDHCNIFSSYAPVCVLKCISHIRLFETLWTVTCQALLSTGLSRQEYWSRSSCPLPGDLPDSESVD